MRGISRATSRSVAESSCLMAQNLMMMRVFG